MRSALEQNKYIVWVKKARKKIWIDFKIKTIECIDCLFDWLRCWIPLVLFSVKCTVFFVCVVNLSVFVVVSVITDRAAHCKVQMRQIRKLWFRKTCRRKEVLSCCFFLANFYASSRSTKMSGTSWSFDDLLKSRLSSAVIHGCSKISSDRIRSSGSLRSNERIMQRAFDVKQSGTRNWPRDILANSDACSESLNGYLWECKGGKTSLWLVTTVLKISVKFEQTCVCFWSFSLDYILSQFIEWYFWNLMTRAQKKTSWRNLIRQFRWNEFCKEEGTYH